MTTSTDDPTPRPLRWLALAVGALAIQWIGWFLLPLALPQMSVFGMLAGLVCGLVIFIWWLFLSRAPWVERIGAFVVMVAAVIAVRQIVHPSVANAGMGGLIYLFSIPLLNLGLVVWAVATRHVATTTRRLSLAGSLALACLVLAAVRIGGVTGDGRPELHWRWTPTPEDRLITNAPPDPVPPPSAPAAPAEASIAVSPVPALPAAPAPASPTPAASTETAPAPRVAAWPGFRGRDRDGHSRAVRIGTEWSSAGPVKMWQREIGPAWSSFAVDGDLLYTQEQRGDREFVSSYRLATGEPVWVHRDAARFWEANAGPGPRGTPSVSNGRVYAHGATGVVNALDAKTGAVIWTRNSSTDTGSTMPGWGFASSPLVVGDTVVVASSGRLVAYDAGSGTPRWFGPRHAGSYSSPHLITIGGVQQILLPTGNGLTSVSIADGTPLWEHDWAGSAMVQPARASETDLLLATADMMGGVGIRRLSILQKAAGWAIEERWTSRGLKPNFNDFVVHDGHAYGFDNNILSCIDIADGTRKWKGGRYGNGQALLLPDQNLLLVVSEDGEIALVRATPDGFTEVARMPAIEGKTWNHPVLVGQVLLVRNGEQMAAFRMPAAR